MSGNFEVLPCGTQARLAEVEAEVRSMRRCFEVTERQRDQYKAERDALFQIVEAIEMALRMGIPAFEVLRASSSIRGEMQSVIAKAQGGGND